ncbi:polysaccharide deacetylase family protein [Paenibacillus macerans]|uniref:polysaccharide deacetylase n=2 Tax=Paenibacillus macerans TaxID=44252 RepID=UPI00242D11A5|nr:polysaccharide deacetylase [Paenibacillus macerans]
MDKKWKSGLMVIRTVLLLTALVWVVSVPLGAEPQGWPEIAAHALAQPPADAPATNKGTAKAGEHAGEKETGALEANAVPLAAAAEQVEANEAAPERLEGGAATAVWTVMAAGGTAAAAASETPAQAAANETAKAKPADGKATVKTADKATNKATNKAADNTDGKVVYLTFDDGPSSLTDEVLDILKKEDVPGTFFVLGEQAKRYPEMIRRIEEAGHTLGNHTYNHEYKELYDSFGHFWKQIKATEEVLRGITGERTPLVRAPGGTYGHFDETYFNLLELGGYKVFDWNVDSGDSKRKGVPASEIIDNVVSANRQNEVIVLLHDGAGHGESVKALPKIIQYYKKQGYAFRAISPDQPPVQFHLDPSMKKKHRTIPSDAWVKANVVPNAALFGPDLPLTVEAGGVQTRLDSGEYRLQDGQYIVPLRTTMERLGAKVHWDGDNQRAVVVWGNAKATFDPNTGTATSELTGKLQVKYDLIFERKNESLWVPLRILMEAAGHPIASLTLREDERRVTAL